VKFELTVDLDRLIGDPAKELGRILRYWAGAAKQLDLTTQQEQAIYDSTYAEVGAWRIS
jgi:Spy/CpxP family protein refolding chaperone